MTPKPPKELTRRCREKRVYRSHAKAEQARLEIEPKTGKRLWSYQCDLCTLWHLSSAPQTAIAVPPERVWTSSLRDLHRNLLKEGRSRPGTWAWYQLPRGALVAYNLLAAVEMPTPTGPVTRAGEVFRIARRGLPTGDRAKAGWAREIGVFLDAFNAKEWELFSVLDEAEDVVSTYAWNREGRT